MLGDSLVSGNLNGDSRCSVIWGLCVGLVPGSDLLVALPQVVHHLFRSGVQRLPALAVH
jgi:hypothetical protein